MERATAETEDALTTDDLFLAGFGLVRGGEIEDVEVRGVNGRRTAFFRIAGRGMEDAEREYFQGNASVNLPLLKFQVKRLKDVAFQAMREKERRDAAPDHTGRDRVHQVEKLARRGRR